MRSRGPGDRRQKRSHCCRMYEYVSISGIPAISELASSLPMQKEAHTSMINDVLVCIIHAHVIYYSIPHAWAFSSFSY